VVDKHRRLVAWECCRELVRDVYRVTARFPAEERFGLTLQLRRAAVSTVANIAEGHARLGTGEFAHALSMALGSLAEVDTLLCVAADLRYLAKPELASLNALRERASRVTFGLQRKVRR
jgi:four helix bundle protein